MDKLEFPDITCSFPVGINSYAQEVHIITKRWGEELGLFQFSQLDSDVFDTIKSGYFSARLFPQASFAPLIMISKYNLLIFVLEDYLEKNRNNSKAYNLVKQMVQIMEGKLSQLSHKNAYLLAWAQWWEKTKKMTPYQWQNRFAKNIQAYLYNKIWKMESQQNDIIGFEVDEDLSYNQNQEKNFHYFDLIEMANTVYLPEKLINNTFIELKTNVSAIINLTNDIISLKKELIASDIDNILLSLHQNQTFIQEVINDTVELQNLYIEEFTRLERELLKNEKIYQREYKTYSLGLQSVIRGNQDWYNISN
ncbi:hypothetical protein SAMN04487943_11138 [Gracilibacillus orientalis]|uniref:Terpene synthase n=1 Tax=Gracilibacillus orientalis TaxID=334253 RepID=A0A1I4PFE5_9BACI|nr:hypothetical protein [Gracilibacillus orientalis]SFM26390.1 hypothetical protein SAMN04487943_11138 [Gracilibacillus orientalis]